MSPEKRGVVTDLARRGQLMQRHPLLHARLMSHPNQLEAQPRQSQRLPMPHYPLAATVYAPNHRPLSLVYY